MKTRQQFSDQYEGYFTSVPVVQVDSGVVKIPVELVDRFVYPQSRQRVLQVTVKKHGFWAWR